MLKTRNRNNSASVTYDGRMNIPCNEPSSRNPFTWHMLDRGLFKIGSFISTDRKLKISDLKQINTPGTITCNVTNIEILNKINSISLSCHNFFTDQITFSKTDSKIDLDKLCFFLLSCKKCFSANIYKLISHTFIKAKHSKVA